MISIHIFAYKNRVLCPLTQVLGTAVYNVPTSHVHISTHFPPPNCSPLAKVTPGAQTLASCGGQSGKTKGPRTLGLLKNWWLPHPHTPSFAIQVNSRPPSTPLKPVACGYENVSVRRLLLLPCSRAISLHLFYIVSSAL